MVLLLFLGKVPDAISYRKKVILYLLLGLSRTAQRNSDVRAYVDCAIVIVETKQVSQVKVL